MKAYCALNDQKAHEPSFFLVNGVAQNCPEKPERMDALVASTKTSGMDLREPQDYGLEPIAAVHTPEYLRFLATIHERWIRMDGASQEVIPGIQPNRNDFSYPQSAIGQAGYHMADTACPIGKNTWHAVQASANCAASAAHDILEGASSAYALCRPPGHHAFADMAGGFCYVNNSALAAQILRRDHERVAIIDVDLHHGNGTQGIFYNRNDVLTVSIHADPVRFYPFFWGHASERGEGDGLGYNYNLPLERGSGDDKFLTALENAMERVSYFAPTALVIALGLDAFEGDPFGGLAVSTDGFGAIGKMLSELKLPSVIVQEGGYLCDALGDNLSSFMDGFQSS
ncbi:MAG: histone deacetylase family protein [Rhodospirillales bacterium]|jgi:acetoin utilization deacetylase AcuC-like enzyme|nr:histone deacetylase family protein [Rhodospirillales bacterium]